VLRIFTIVAPFLIGTAAAYLGRESFVSMLTAGFFIGVASVAGMLGVTARLDGVDWFPTSSRDQREMAEYILAIWFAFSAGYFVIRALSHTVWVKSARPHRSPTALPPLTGDASQRKAGFERIEGLASALTAIGSAGTALYSGLRTFFE